MWSKLNKKKTHKNAFFDLENVDVMCFNNRFSTYGIQVPIFRKKTASTNEKNNNVFLSRFITYHLKFSRKICARIPCYTYAIPATTTKKPVGNAMSCSDNHKAQ